MIYPLRRSLHQEPLVAPSHPLVNEAAWRRHPALALAHESLSFVDRGCEGQASFRAEAVDAKSCLVRTRNSTRYWGGPWRIHLSVLTPPFGIRHCCILPTTNLRRCPVNRCDRGARTRTNWVDAIIGAVVGAEGICDKVEGAVGSKLTWSLS